MQRMLVGLLVFLTAVVGALAVMLFQLQDQVDSKQARASAPARTSDTQGADPERVAKLERRVTGLLRQIEALREQHRATVRALAKGVPSDGKGSDDPRIQVPESGLTNAARRADRISVTKQDEAFYLAVKKSVDRKQRIENTFRATMRRLDRFAIAGTIQPIEGEDRKQVEKATLKYVTSSEDLMARYYRSPNEQVKALPVEQRREAVTQERETILVQFQNDLATVIGAEDAQAVTSRMLKGVRRIRPQGKNNLRRRKR